MAKVEDFHPGQIVRYVGTSERRAYLTGKQAMVVRGVKSRKVVTIEFLDDRTRYDAFPKNLETT